MMKEGYGWIITAGLSSLLDPMGSKVMHSMQGIGKSPFNYLVSLTDRK
jgi:hypothetical protein